MLISLLHGDLILCGKLFHTIDTLKIKNYVLINVNFLCKNLDNHVLFLARDSLKSDILKGDIPYIILKIFIRSNFLLYLLNSKSITTLCLDVFYLLNIKGVTVSYL